MIRQQNRSNKLNKKKKTQEEKIRAYLSILLNNTSMLNLKQKYKIINQKAKYKFEQA